MASPFRAFRKYQKTLLAIAGVLLIFVFVLGDPLSQYLNSSGGAGSAGGSHPGDVAVKWDGGQLTNAELNQLVMQRLIVNNFVRTVEAFGREAATQAGGEPQPLRVAPIIGPERPQDGVERSVLQMRLFADAARKAGMAISDDHLVDYLQQLGRGYVSVNDLRAILNSLNVGGRRTSIDFVLDALREEMLARNYLASYTFAFDTSLPEQRWKDWLNVNDRVVVEAAAVPAESMLIDVPEPSEAELTAFFEEYKDREPRPVQLAGVELPSPTPGFAVPRKIAVQYLLADFNQFLTKVENEVTDEEIEKFYEDNKDPYFVQAESMLLEPTDTTGITAPESDDSSETNGTEPEGEDANGGPADGDDSSQEKTEPKAEQESSRDVSSSPFRLAAFADDAPAGGEGESDGRPADPPDAAPTVDDATATVGELDERPKKFQPLEEVSDEIRRQIAQIKVSEQLADLMNSLESELNESYTEYFGATLDAEDEGKTPPPPPEKLADLTPLAKEHGLVYQKTEPASMLELRDTPVGMSVRPDEANMPFYYSIFGRDVELYQPITTFDLDNNRYLAMKTEDIPGAVPKLDEIRDKVVRAWKLRKAGELAVKRAEELARKAQDSGASLEDAFAGEESVEVIKTDPFAFLTAGTISRDTRQVQSFRLSEPDGIVAAGPEFMEEVFSLKDGEVGAAPNHDRSIAYVVRIAEHQNTPAELRQAFLSEADNWYGSVAMANGRYRMAYSALVNDLLSSSNVDWERDPDVPMQAETESEADES